MNLLLRCEDVTRFATDHLEGRLAAPLSLRMKAHLGLCRTCRAFVASLQALPRLVGTLLEAPAEAIPSETDRTRQHAALAAALGRISLKAPAAPPAPAHPIPGPALAAAAAPDTDRTLRLMVQAYQAIHSAGPVPEAPYLPEALRRELPEPAAWTWRSALLMGCRAAELAQDPRTGSRLFLLVLPPDQRFPDHAHRSGEDFLVLHGYAEDDHHYLGPGDWLRLPEATDHRHLEGRQEICWGLARVERQGIRLLGWRGLLQRAFGG